MDIFSNINIPGYVIFALAGYFCGYLFRNTGFIKIIAIIVIVPAILQFVITIDEMLWVTIPFLIGVVLGLAGTEKLKRAFIIAGDSLQDLLRRFR